MVNVRHDANLVALCQRLSVRREAQCCGSMSAGLNGDPVELEGGCCLSVIHQNVLDVCVAVVAGNTGYLSVELNGAVPILLGERIGVVVAVTIRIGQECSKVLVVLSGYRRVSSSLGRRRLNDSRF